MLYFNITFVGDIASNRGPSVSETCTNDGPSSTNGTYVYGINDAGQIVGFSYDSGDTAYGFIYSGGIYTTLDDPFNCPTSAPVRQI